MGSVRLPLDFQLLQSISKKQEGGPRRPTTHWEGEDFIGKNPWKNTVATQKSPGFLKKSGFSPKMNWIFQDFPLNHLDDPSNHLDFPMFFPSFFVWWNMTMKKNPGIHHLVNLVLASVPSLSNFLGILPDPTKIPEALFRYVPTVAMVMLRIWQGHLPHSPPIQCGTSWECWKMGELWLWYHSIWSQKSSEMMKWSMHSLHL